MRRLLVSLIIVAALAVPAAAHAARPASLRSSVSIPSDVIVTDTWNLKGGKKATIGFSCSHDFLSDDDNNPDTPPIIVPSGPIFFGQVREGRGGHFEVWYQDNAYGLASAMASLGAPLTDDQIEALEATRTNANCG